MTKAILQINGKPTEVFLTDEQVKDIVKSSLKVEDRVKTVEDAYADRGYDINKKRPFPNPKDEWEEDLNAVADTWVFIEAMNQGQIAHEKPGDKAYYPIFNLHANNEAGFGFAAVGCGWAHSHSFVGSRFSFIERNKAEYAAVQIRPTYQKFMKK